MVTFRGLQGVGGAGLIAMAHATIADIASPRERGRYQVYLSGTWYDVDATIEGVRPAFIPIAVGRDAADVAMTTLWGNGTLREQSVEVREIDGPG